MVETAGQDWSHDTAATRLRIVTAASLFDGHDAAIHIMRRLIQTHGTEVIHLGHHRSALDVVRAALQEDANAIVVSSHHGGHVEYFTCMIDMLQVRGADHIPVFVCSHDVFAADEIAELDACGVACVYHTPTGTSSDLTQTITDLIARTRRARDIAHTRQRPAAAQSAVVADVHRTGTAQDNSPSASESPAIDDDARRNFPAWWPVPPPPKAAPSPPAPIQFNDIHWTFGTQGQTQPLMLIPSPSPDTIARSGMPAQTAQTVPVTADPELMIGRMLTRLEEEHHAGVGFHELRKSQPWMAGMPPVIGITGTGGAGKSSVTDELLIRFLASFPKMRIAVLSVDPTRRRSGGALLGDRIRMNALRNPRVYMRSMATRRQHMATSTVLQDCIQSLKGQDFDLIIVETAGIGQSDSNIVDLVDLPVYVMTSDYGASSQLEKIDMLDFAELIILNKYDQRGAADALRDIRQQWRRNRQAYDLADDQIPVYPTIASQCNDPGTSWMFANLCRVLRERLQGTLASASDPAPNARCDFNPALEITEKRPNTALLIPPQRMGYLTEIAEQGRAIHTRIQSQAVALTRAQQCWQALGELNDPARPAALAPFPPDVLNDASADTSLATLRRCYHESIDAVSADALQLLRDWHRQQTGMIGAPLSAAADLKALSRQSMPTIATVHYHDWGDLLRFLAEENLPGEYPYTSGIQTGHRHGCSPVEIVADDGPPERGNHQFHAASRGHSEIRLTALFDSVTLYGEDPDERLDIYGRIGHGGVNVATLDAMKKLYSGFDLCAPEISVSMTVNDPAPILLAMFINTAIDQQVEHYLKQDPARWQQAQQRMDAFFMWRPRPDYDLELPPGHTTLGLGLLGISGDQLVDPETYARIKAQTLSSLRGRVRVDVLEQDQARNTCIFSPEFSLRMLGDVQQYRVEHGIRHLHTASVSAVHFAKAGATPITQLAFALANGFTLVEYYLARGIKIDQMAPDFCFFFSIGDELEYSVLGRVARRIWARAMRERYGAHSHSQAFNIQLQARDERDAPNRLPQEIMHNALGVNLCENPWQGSFVISALTDLVEAAIYREFESLNTRGGVLGALGSLYQRDKIQDERMQRTPATTADGSPGGTVRVQAAMDTESSPPALTPTEKTRLIANVQLWHGMRNALPPGPLGSETADTASSADGQSRDQYSGLLRLQHVARGHGNLFAELMETVKTHSLGQITHALYAAGGEYRRTI